MILRAALPLTTPFSSSSSALSGKALQMRSQEEEGVMGIELLKAMSLVSSYTLFPPYNSFAFQDLVMFHSENCLPNSSTLGPGFYFLPF